MPALSALRRWRLREPGSPQGTGHVPVSGDTWSAWTTRVLSFAVWMLWSVVVVYLPEAGFRYSINQLFWLTALPAFSGATLRIFCVHLVPALGARRFTVLVTASLLLPVGGLGLAVQDPTTPYEIMVALALLCGLGGGSLAGFRPDLGLGLPAGRHGPARTLPAGLDHLGVVLMQWLVPVVIGVALFGDFNGPAQSTGRGPMWLQNAGWAWVPPILAGTVAAGFGRDDRALARIGFAQQAIVFTRRHSWLVCWLCLGTLGSFLGLSASLPLLAQNRFPQVPIAPLVWLAPLIGILARPLGTWLADRLGGARVTFWSFVALAMGAAIALYGLSGAGAATPTVEAGLWTFLSAFALLFAAAGLGLGSSFRMIATLFLVERQRRAEDLPSTQVQAAQDADLEAAAVLCFASAIGAYGGFLIPKSFGTSLALTGSPAAALLMLLTVYLSCLALTWWMYGRRNAPHPC